MAKSNDGHKFHLFRKTEKRPHSVGVLQYLSEPDSAQTEAARGKQHVLNARAH